MWYSSAYGCGLHHPSPLWVTRVVSSSKYTYRVYLGKHNLKEDEQGSVAIAAAKIIEHENYNILLSRNDIALIKLQTPVTFSDSIMAACLPDAGYVLPHNAPCYVTGWGRLWTDGPGSDILQQALLPVVGHEVCSLPDWWYVLATKDMVCAGGDGVVAGCN
ncbi:chymotrypsin-C-like, partial [Engraulis encrasicolus]|uniref:chymotrypsin-C-like n=1 Tax=Engraulis encrasicolus TaxID=184585 RepID=UPI002FCF00A1